MKFDFKDKDIKSWGNRFDVKQGDEGYFFNSFIGLELRGEVIKGKIRSIGDLEADCFYDEKNNSYPFFLPLDKVKIKEKKTSQKKYRPIKSMNDLTRAVYNISPSYANLMNVGDVLYVKRKYNNHYYKLLITHLDFDENHNLVSINGESLRALFENYEIKNVDDDLVPFGVEVKDDE